MQLLSQSTDHSSLKCASTVHAVLIICSEATITDQLPHSEPRAFAEGQFSFLLFVIKTAPDSWDMGEFYNH